MGSIFANSGSGLGRHGMNPSPTRRPTTRSTGLAISLDFNTNLDSSPVNSGVRLLRWSGAEVAWDAAGKQVPVGGK